MNRMKKFEEDNCGERKEGYTSNAKVSHEEEEDFGDDEIDCIAERFLCTSLHNRDSFKLGRSWEKRKHGEWREEQKIRASRLEKQLRARWELEKLIEEQLGSFRAHFERAMVPTLLRDVPELLAPEWAPPHELASVCWLGDWRPSNILELALGLVRSSPSSSSCSSSMSFSDSPGAEQNLIELLRELRIEEAILDEEMAEIQATCVLHLPFGPMNIRSGKNALSCVKSVFKTIEHVITKAQHLRYKALEMVLKRVLSLTDAAEFLVAFEEIQGSIHKFAKKQRLQKGSLTVPVSDLGSFD